MNLTNSDVGAIGGFDADGGTVLTAESVLPNRNTYDDTPTSLNVIFPDAGSGVAAEQVSFQVGASANETISSFLSGFSAANLSISTIDVSSDPTLALVAIDRALEYVTSSRSEMGAVQNRLLSTISNLSNIGENVTAARSRISDADFATESAGLVRNQILQQAGISVLAQANSMPRMVLSLLS
jgi:flagellin